MKDVFKVIWMSLLALFAATVMYPAIHEFGHSLAIWIFGGQVIEISWIPTPHVLCSVPQLNDTALVIIGLAGLIFPAIVFGVIKYKNFYLWYTAFLLKGITILSVAISGIIAAMRLAGSIVLNDDITSVLDLWDGGTAWIISGALLISGLYIWQMIKEHPVRRLLVQFELGLSGEH